MTDQARGFDADAFLATLTPPTVTVGGVTYTGRHLSAVQWMRAVAAVDRAREAGSLLAWAAAAHLTFSLMFPKPWWAVWRRSVAKRLLAAPPALWQAALADFFGSPTTPGAVTTTTPATTTAAGPTFASADWSGISSPPTASASGSTPPSGAPETA